MLELKQQLVSVNTDKLSQIDQLPESTIKENKKKGEIVALLRATLKMNKDQHGFSDLHHDSPLTHQNTSISNFCPWSFQASTAITQSNIMLSPTHTFLAWDLEKKKKKKRSRASWKKAGELELYRHWGMLVQPWLHIQLTSYNLLVNPPQPQPESFALGGGSNFILSFRV